MSTLAGIEGIIEAYEPDAAPQLQSITGLYNQFPSATLQGAGTRNVRALFTGTNPQSSEAAWLQHLMETGFVPCTHDFYLGSSREALLAGSARKRITPNQYELSIDAIEIGYGPLSYRVRIDAWLPFNEYGFTPNTAFQVPLAGLTTTGTATPYGYTLNVGDRLNDFREASNLDEWIRAPTDDHRFTAQDYTQYGVRFVSGGLQGTEELVLAAADGQVTVTLSPSTNTVTVTENGVSNAFTLAEYTRHAPSATVGEPIRADRVVLDLGAGTLRVSANGYVVLTTTSSVTVSGLGTKATETDLAAALTGNGNTRRYLTSNLHWTASSGVVAANALGQRLTLGRVYDTTGGADLDEQLAHLSDVEWRVLGVR